MTMTTDTKLCDQRDDTNETVDTESPTASRHPALAAMHRLSEDDIAREEYHITRALEEGEYSAKITGVGVSPRRHIFGEGFGTPDEDRDDPELLTGYITDPSAENVADVLETWREYEQRQITHLTYGDNVYFKINIPSVGERYVSAVDFLDYSHIDDSTDFPLLGELLSPTSHLSDLIGTQVIVSDITTSHVTLATVTGGSNRLSLLSEDAGPYNTDTELLTDVSGAFHYLQEATRDSPWIGSQYDLYIDHDHETVAVAVDVCGVTRVFKFDIDMNEQSKYRYFIDELGGGAPNAVSGTIPVALASYAHVTRGAHRTWMTDDHVIGIDTTGCWALGNPEKVGSTPRESTDRNPTLRHRILNTIF